jgi:glucose 1-dehydrogenase
MSYSPSLLQGQKALVTGGSSGIGAGVVRQLAKAGATVAINYHSHGEAAEKIVEDIKSAHGEAIAIQADVSQEADVKAMFSKVLNEFGTIDILVYNLKFLARREKLFV